MAVELESWSGRTLAVAWQAGAPRAFAVIRCALVDHRSVPRAARALGVARRTLEKWLRITPALAAGVELPRRGRPRPH